MIPVARDLWYLENRGIDSTSSVISCTENLFFDSRKDPDKIQSIAVNEDNIMQILFVETNYPEAELVYCSDIQACLDSVVRGEADGTIVNGYRTAKVTGHNSYQMLAYIPASGDTSRCFGVSESNSSLLLLLNRGLKIIGSDYGADIANKYVAEYYSYSTADFIKDNVIWFSLIILVIVAVIISILLRNVSNEKKHAAELREANAEQEAQLEEITALNSELETAKEAVDTANAQLTVELEAAENARKEAVLNSEIISSISKMYFAIFQIDLANDFYEEISSDSEVHRLTGHEGSAYQRMMELCDNFVTEEFDAEIREFFNLSTLSERLADVDTIQAEYLAIDGNWHQARFIAKRRDEQGKTTHVLYITRLVSDEKRKELEAALLLQEAKTAAEVANAAKTTFLFNMSHDIRTPMNAIIGYADLMERYFNDPERCRNYLGKIRNSSDLLLSLINNVLEMSRIESGKMVLDEVPSSVLDIGNNVSNVFEELMREKNLAFSLTNHFETPYIYIDKVKVNEIYVNLISNAYKYTPEGGTVTVDVREMPSEKENGILVQVTVSDTGIGMSKDYLPHIFDEFSREHSSTESRIQGSGLGMPIVKKLVELMNGTITVESELGKGTTFVVTLPHRIADETVMKPQYSEKLTREAFTGKRILLAEDNDLNAEIATEILSEAGFIVERAEDGIVCVDKFSESENGYYDLILMDIQMPKMNGYEATKQIRALDKRQKARIPILAMTANAFEEDKQNALRAGMNGHLSKPINMAELMKALSGILG